MLPGSIRLDQIVGKWRTRFYFARLPALYDEPHGGCEKMLWVSGKDPLFVWLLLFVPADFACCRIRTSNKMSIFAGFAP